ncbi:GTPase [Neosynechococcus sphagnicola sy1]|uniref:GTPase n=1 Tax=Neosynechococcus sphagnicola sy1 TaxID=1497020 RepID=A0A098TJA5_9CYAN|nr:GTP-binding protein [Neosynechococcus sphagnicola]KGF72174.1 GTPase [Neosynechococcus sphagnicola sy1]
MLSAASLQEVYLNRARASLRQTLNRYGRLLHQSRHPPLDAALQARLKAESSRLGTVLDQLDQGLVRIAAFGLVSRGKSAVLNALMGEKVLQTGPLHGITQWPRSVRWSTAALGSKVRVEFIDTPGLDEVDGQTRAQMAREIAAEADLILFVVAGDITRTEYQALCELQTALKPLILVFNKIDLYPDADRKSIYQTLQQLFATSDPSHPLQRLISADEVVRVAADPAPRQVRIQWPDGRITHEWETPLPQVEELKQAILQLLNREGRVILALNALLQARAAEAAIARTTLTACQTEAEALIWQFTKVKAIAVGLNPIPVLDILGGLIADLSLIRALARLYGLPMTRYDAGKLWKTIVMSACGLFLGEWGSGLWLGLGKSGAIASALSQADVGGAVWAQLTTGLPQALIAGYGTYAVGRSAQVYLEQGCTWGAEGSSTLIQEILSQVDRTTILHRLRQELAQMLE